MLFWRSPVEHLWLKFIKHTESVDNVQVLKLTTLSLFFLNSLFRKKWPDDLHVNCAEIKAILKWANLKTYDEDNKTGKHSNDKNSLKRNSKTVESQKKCETQTNCLNPCEFAIFTDTKIIFWLVLKI